MTRRRPLGIPAIIATGIRHAEKERNCVEAGKTKIEALRANIEELHVLIAAVKKQADAEFCLRVKKEEEYMRLRAKIEEMEKQEPVRWSCTVLQTDGSWKEEIGIEEPPKDYFSIRNAFPLYALPGAKGEEK